MDAALAVKNTFLDILDPGFTNLADLDPQSWSCPAAAFGGDTLDSFNKLSGLAAAARAFSHGSLTREALEAAGHLGPRHISIGREKPSHVDCVSTTDGISSSEHLQSASSTQSVSDVDTSVESDHDAECQWPLSPLTSADSDSIPSSPINMILPESLSQAPIVVPRVPQSWAMHPPPPPPQPAPSQPAPSLPSSDNVPPPPEVPPQKVLLTWFRVAFLGGIQLRIAPSVNAPRTDTVLFQNETFGVNEEISGADGRIYLRLADGRGWAFDDTALNPEDASVKRGHWAALPLAPLQPVLASPSPVSQPSWIPAVPSSVDENAPAEPHKRRRRKRGGVRRNRSKRNAAGMVEDEEASDAEEGPATAAQDCEE